MQGQMELVAIYDEIEAKMTSLMSTIDHRVHVCGSVDDIIRDPEIQLVVEAASQKAAKYLIPKALAAGKDVMVMSVGVFSDSNFYQEIKELSSRMRAKIYIPSGAIGGLDWIKAASSAGLTQVTITTRKPPAALEGSPHVVKNKIDLAAIRSPTQIYEGPATDAAASFPANVNVAVALSLAGIGPEKTRVRVIADPTIERNIHEIIAEGQAGSIELKVENLPAPTNPKTSWVAALSAIRKLKEIVEFVSVGT